VLNTSHLKKEPVQLTEAVTAVAEILDSDRALEIELGLRKIVQKINNLHCITAVAALTT